MIEIQNSTLLSKDSMHKCDIFGHQFSQKKTLARHKKILHYGNYKAARPRGSPSRSKNSLQTM